MTVNAGQDTGNRTGTGEVLPPHGGRLAAPWQKGQSGNPGGLPVHLYNEARKTCAQASPAAVARQIELMGSDDERVALMATEAVLRRGIGAPRDHAGDAPGAQINLASLSGDDLQTLATLLRKALGG